VTDRPPHEVNFEVGVDTLAPRQARRRLVEELSDVPEVDLDTVEVLVSELVTNVVRHVGSRARVRLIIDTDCVRVEVADTSREVPAVRPLRRDVATGRGLRIVEELSDRWGVETMPVFPSERAGLTENPDPYEKAVWFELDRG
jgi:hypothetical protein